MSVEHRTHGSALGQMAKGVVFSILARKGRSAIRSTGEGLNERYYRAYLIECWAEDQMTVLSFFFSDLALEDRTSDDFADLLEEEGILRCVGGMREVSAKRIEDQAGQGVWSASVLVRFEDEVFIEDELSLKPYPRDVGVVSGPTSSTNATRGCESEGRFNRQIVDWRHVGESAPPEHSPSTRFDQGEPVRRRSWPETAMRPTRRQGPWIGHQTTLSTACSSRSRRPLRRHSEPPRACSDGMLTQRVAELGP